MFQDPEFRYPYGRATLMDDNIIGSFLNKCGQIRYTFMIMVNRHSNHSNLSHAVSSTTMYDDYAIGVSLLNKLYSHISC